MSLPDRQHLSFLIGEAVVSGARRSECCKAIDLNVRTLQRWEKKPTEGDQRHGPKTVSCKQLSEDEKLKLFARN